MLPVVEPALRAPAYLPINVSMAREYLPANISDGNIDVPGVYYPGPRDKGAGSQRHDGRPSSRSADIRGIWMFPIECEEKKPAPVKKQDQYPFVRGASGWNSMKLRKSAEAWASERSSPSSSMRSRATRTPGRDQEVDALLRRVADLEAELDSVRMVPLEASRPPSLAQSSPALPPLSAPSGRGPL